MLLTLEELVSLSDRIAVVVAEERSSRWEEAHGSRRIVTYTKLRVESSLRGSKAKPGETEHVWVRTLGGIVDKVGQHVAGEAQFTLGERAVVFLKQDGERSVVTGMAQGHYPLAMKDGHEVLVSSPDTGALLPKRGPRLSARERLLTRKLAEAQADILKVIEAQQK